MCDNPRHMPAPTTQPQRVLHCSINECMLLYEVPQYYNYLIRM